MKKLKVVVLFGGTSSERDVSLSSGIEVINALRSKGHEVVGIDTAFGLLSQKDEEKLVNHKVSSDFPKISSNVDEISIIRSTLQNQDLKDTDIYFIALHGGIGENGTIQAILSLANLPYTGSNHVSSGLAMDKDLSKKLFKCNNIATPNWQVFNGKVDDVESFEFSFPCVVKPNLQGSSIGISVASNQNDLDKALSLASEYDDEVVVEEFIKGRELSVGVLGDNPLAVGEILLENHTFFDYVTKYDAKTKEVFPADINEKIKHKAQELALQAHKLLKLFGHSRADFRLDGSDNLWLLEINTVPGLCKTSLFPQSAKAEGIDFATLCETMCYLGIKKYKNS